MSRLQQSTAVMALFATTGCLPETGVRAPLSAALSMPTEINVSWADAYNQRGDGYGALWLMDILVYDEGTGSAMDNIQVEMVSGWSGVYMIPKTAVKTVAYPTEPEGDCDVNGDDIIDDNADDACAWYFDTAGNTYFQLASDFADAYRPNYLIGATDEFGQMRVYLYIDDLPPEGDDEFSDVYLTASLGHTTESTVITTAAD